MPGSAWQVGRNRDFRGGETQAELPEEVGRNQLIRMENAMLFPSGWLTAAHQADTTLITGATLGVAIVPGANGTYTAHSAAGDGFVYSKLLDTSATTSFTMDAGTPHAVAGSRIVGVHRAVRFLGKDYVPNPNSDDTKDGVLNLTDYSIHNIAGSSATASKLRLYLNRLWMIFSDGTLRHSDNGSASSWNALNTILLPNSEPVVDFHPVQGGAIVYSSTAIYAMYGSTYSDITFIQLAASSPDSPKHFTTGSVEVNGAVFILSAHGVYRATLNGAELIPHRQNVFFRAHYDIFSDPAKTGVTATYLAQFQAILFSWPAVYKIGGQSLIFYLSGAMSKLNRLLPTEFPYIVAMNDVNTDYLVGTVAGTLVKSEYPNPNMLTPQPAILQTRHEDCDSFRDKVWSEFVITTNEPVFGLTLQAYLDYSDTPVTVADNAACAKGENTFWLDDLPRSKTISMLINIDSQSPITLVSDDDENTVITDEYGNELAVGSNPSSWTIKEIRLRYREAGPAL